MTRRTWKLTGIAVTAIVSVATLITPLRSASALPPRCTNDQTSCPEPPDPPGDQTGPQAPDPQPRPPAPFGQPSEFDYGDFANVAFAGIDAKLKAPQDPGEPIWPLSAIPYQPEIIDAPVKIAHARDNIWAFVSYDAGGRPGDCVGTCSSPPDMPLNPNYGLYQATLQLRPRLDIELWKVQTGTDGQGHPTPLQAYFVTEATATLHMRAFAECNGWETGTATLNAKIGVGDVTLQRDVGIIEKIYNVVFPGLTASQNRAIRDKLIDKIGVGKFDPNPLAHGHPCHTLDISGGPSDGAILWNEAPCLHPETGCSPGGVNSQ
jgi:hypothetical protein